MKQPQKLIETVGILQKLVHAELQYFYSPEFTSIKGGFLEPIFAYNIKDPKAHAGKLGQFSDYGVVVRWRKNSEQPIDDYIYKLIPAVNKGLIDFSKRAEQFLLRELTTLTEVREDFGRFIRALPSQHQQLAQGHIITIRTGLDRFEACIRAAREEATKVEKLTFNIRDLGKETGLEICMKIHARIANTIGYLSQSLEPLNKVQNALSQLKSPG